MNSDKQREMYRAFESDANEILFGHRTAPTRPLTDKEVMTRKKIILKLVDQKLKFELIEMMRKSEQQTFTPFSSSNYYDYPSNYYNSHGETSNSYGYSGYHNFNQNSYGYGLFGSDRQYDYPHTQSHYPHIQPVYPPAQHFENPVHTMWTQADYNFQPKFQFPEQYQNAIGGPIFNLNHNKHNPNLIQLSTDPSKNTEPKRTSIDCPINGKLNTATIINWVIKHCKIKMYLNFNWLFEKCYNKGLQLATKSVLSPIKTN